MKCTLHRYLARRGIETSRKQGRPDMEINGVSRPRPSRRTSRTCLAPAAKLVVDFVIATHECCNLPVLVAGVTCQTLRSPGDFPLRVVFWRRCPCTFAVPLVDDKWNRFPDCTAICIATPVESSIRTPICIETMTSSMRRRSTTRAAPTRRSARRSPGFGAAGQRPRR